MLKLTKCLAVLVFASILLAACGEKTATPIPTESTKSDMVVAEGHVIPNADLQLSFIVRSRVTEILVSADQLVKKGDVLARQGDSQQAQAAVAAANLELIQTQQTYDEFVRTADLSSAQAFEAYHKTQIERSKAQLIWEVINPNTIKDDIDTAQADVQDKKKILDDANDTLNKYLNLKSDNPTRRKAEDDVRKAEADHNTAIRKMEELQRSIDTPRAVLDSALAAEAEAKRNYENTKNASLDPDKKAVILARLNNAKAQVTAVQATLDNYDLRAPFDGLVTDVNMTVGELVGSDNVVIQMADTSKWFIETSDLTELEVVKVKVGQPVEIAPDALPDVKLTGVVESISSSSKTQGGDILYTVKIKLNDSNPDLRWGMTIQATFMPFDK